ncbi:MAG: rRNA maturation RNase YbeY [Dehalococcoidia bacterium]
MIRKNEISVSIAYSVEGQPDGLWFEELSKKILDYLNLESSVEFSLVITDNATIQQLNKTYKGEDSPTDVLSFSMSDDEADNESDNFIVPPDGVKHLGEVIISSPRALEQAQQYGHDISAELAILLVHGILHLMGFDHGDADDMATMRAREAEILKNVCSISLTDFNLYERL